MISSSGIDHNSSENNVCACFCFCVPVCVYVCVSEAVAKLLEELDVPSLCVYVPCAPAHRSRVIDQMRRRMRSTRRGTLEIVNHPTTYRELYYYGFNMDGFQIEFVWKLKNREHRKLHYFAECFALCACIVCVFIFVFVQID